MTTTKAAVTALVVMLGSAFSDWWMFHVAQELGGLLLALVLFGVFPAIGARILSWAFPLDDPRRVELRAEIRAVPALERLWWLAGQVDSALFEGLGARCSAIREARRIRWAVNILTLAGATENDALVRVVDRGRWSLVETVTLKAGGPALTNVERFPRGSLDSPPNQATLISPSERMLTIKFGSNVAACHVADTHVISSIGQRPARRRR